MFQKEVKSFYLQKLVNKYPNDSIEVLKSEVEKIITEEWLENNLIGEKNEVISMLIDETNCSEEEAEMNFTEIENDGEFILGFSPLIIEKITVTKKQPCDY